MIHHKQQLRKQIIQYFRSVGSGQNIIQCIKQALFLHESFNPVLLFQVIGKNKQKITSQDWKRFLLEHNIMFTQDEFKYFIKQNEFKCQTSLNQFLQSMIPYNADVVRQFKQKYLQALQIRQFSPQVEFIFTQLIDNQFKLFRSLISIRQQITKIATLKQIQSIVKEDLVMQSKPRQARKFHQAFQNKKFKLTFHELRKFFQLWVSNKQIIHEFYMLNVIRHLKSDYPFTNLIYKQKKNKFKNQQLSPSKRPQSAKHQRSANNLTNQKLKEKTNKNYQDPNYQSSYGKNWNQSANKDKYVNFKDKILNQYVQSRKNQLFQNKDQSPSKNLQNSSYNKNSRQQMSISNQQRQNLRRSRKIRESRGIDGTVIIRFLQEIVIKQQRLQKLRKTLAKNNDFNLINLFKLLDNRNKGHLCARDITDYTLLGKVPFNHMVNYFAKQNDRLRFYQFCLIFRPLSKQLNELIDSRPEHKVPNPFKSQTNKLILQIFNQTAQLHGNLSKLRIKMNSQGISPRSMFVFIDLNQKGYLDAQSIQKTLKQNNIYCDDKNMKCLMKIFKKKIDQRIIFEQLRDFISL